MNTQLHSSTALDLKTIYSNLSDSRLVERVALDDNWACTTLMMRYKDALRFEIHKMIYNESDSESIMMQSFAKAFINIRQYNTQFAFSTWLFRIAKNSCIDFLRNMRLKVDTISIDRFHNDNEDTPDASVLPANFLNPEEEMMKKQRARILYKKVAKLRPTYRAVIKQYYFKELSIAEVSESLDMPMGRVKLYLFRARKELYEMYEMAS